MYVAGSNSKDVLIGFKGRGDEIHIFPLTLKEFITFNSGSKEDAYEEYCLYGGLPHVALIDDKKQKTDYLITQMNNVFIWDIVSRYNLLNDGYIGELVDILSSSISTLVNPPKLVNTFKSQKGSSISKTTVFNYIKYLEETFIFCVKRFDVKGKNMK